MRHVCGPDKTRHLRALSVPWRQAFSEWHEETAPGICLAGARYREGLTQGQLAIRTGISEQALSAMERGKCRIRPHQAQRLAAVLHIDVRVLLLNPRGDE